MSVKSGEIRAPFKLICFAWAVEAVAVSLGLILAIFTWFQVISNNGQIPITRELIFQGQGLDALIGALPFLLVAIVELAKIPLTQALLVARNWFLKGIIAVGLALLILVTFETMFNGLERFFVARTQEITKIDQRILDADRRMQPIISERDRIQSQLNSNRTTQAASEQTQRENIQRTQDLARSTVTSRELEAQLQKDLTAWSAKNTETQSQINELNSQITTIENEKARFLGEKSEKINDSQVHRIAALMFGLDDPTDVNRDQLKFIALLWFGSLAAIAASMGVILSLAYYTIKYQKKIGFVKTSAIYAYMRKANRLLRKKHESIIHVNQTAVKETQETVDQTRQELNSMKVLLTNLFEEVHGQLVESRDILAPSINDATKTANNFTLLSARIEKLAEKVDKTVNGLDANVVMTRAEILQDLAIFKEAVKQYTRLIETELNRNTSAVDGFANRVKESEGKIIEVSDEVVKEVNNLAEKIESAHVRVNKHEVVTQRHIIAQPAAKGHLTHG